MNKKLWFILGVFCTLLLVLVAPFFASGVFVDTYQSENSTIARIWVDPTGYGVTLQMLHDRYSEFMYMEHAGNQWLFHFSKNPTGEEQRDDFAMILESITLVDTRYFAAEGGIYKCSPEYIPQIDKFGIICESVV